MTRAIPVNHAVAFAQSEFRHAEGAVFGHASGTFRILREASPSRLAN